MAELNRVDNLMKHRSRWPVTDISRTGQFVRVRVRPGVMTLRLSRTLGTADDATHVRLQISGPNVTFSVADLLPICLIVLLVLSFGAAEHNRYDVHAYPRGLHPVIVAGQMLMLALFACFLITYARAGPSESRLGLLVLDGAVALSMSRWLWVTEAAWRSEPRLISARRSVISLTVFLGIAGILIAFWSGTNHAAASALRNGSFRVPHVPMYRRRSACPSGLIRSKSRPRHRWDLRRPRA